MKRYVFILSDGTGITAETLGNSLISQFDTIDFEKITIPYVDSVEKAHQVVEKISHYAKKFDTKPLIFITLVNRDIRQEILKAPGSVFDLFNTFLVPLEIELGEKSSFTVGRSHGVIDSELYDHRIEAVNYALAHDDGVKIKNYSKADIILIGVSRCGKTPSCLYMALQFGTLAANYPFTDDDLTNLRLPESLRPHKAKLFGLTIEPERLQQIRSERRPDSQYASIEQCRLEVNEVEAMFRREAIPFLNSTRYSIEEIATRILAMSGISRRIN